jgi:CDP-glycerol glycerophosphotransferase (TagB/SpsB family)
MAQKKGSAGKDLLNWCRSKLVIFLDRVYSKDKRIIICGSSNGRQFYGCPREIYEYLVKECPKEFDTYYYLNEGPAKDPRCLTKGGNFNWKTIKTILKAQTVIGSHGLQDFGPWGFSSKKLFIETCHGFPVKAMSQVSPASSKKNRAEAKKTARLANRFLAASDYQAELFAKGWGVGLDKILVVGQPKNDKLVRGPVDKDPDFMRGLPEHRKVIFYCPTFREWGPTKLFPFEDFDKGRFDKFLEDNKIVILIRYHINEGEDLNKYVGGHCIDFSYNKFPNIQNEDVLQHVDSVMTDYSSIYCDFLLLDRPLIFLPYDLEEYKTQRGFMVEDFNKWSPGPKPKTFEEFLQVLKDLADGKDEFRAERKRVNDIINTKQTAHTPEKVVDYLRKELAKY